MRIFLIYVMILSFVFTQFKSDRQNNIESWILAPCCYGGIVSEHNSMITKLISNLIKNLTKENFSEQKIKDDFNEIIDISIKNGFIKHQKPKYDFTNKIHSKMQDNEILDLFIDIYGEKIRAIPQDNIFGKITWFFPILIILISLGLLYFIINNLSKKEHPILSKKEMLVIENKIENYNRNQEE